MTRSDRASIGWTDHVADYLVRSAGEHSAEDADRVVGLLTEQPAALRELARYLDTFTRWGIGPEMTAAAELLGPAAREVLTLARIGLAPQ